MELAHRTSLDYISIALYILFLSWGWLSIYASEYQSIYISGKVLSVAAQRQLWWIGLVLALVLVQLWINHRIYESFAYVLYGLGIILLVFVMFFGKEVSGARSWLVVGSMNIQVSEFAKYTTLLALAKFLSTPHLQPSRLLNQVIMISLVLFPALLIVLQGDLGTSMVYISLFVVMHRGGLNPTLIALGIYVMVMFALIFFVPRLVLTLVLVVISLFTLAFVRHRYRLWVGVIGVLTLSFTLGVSYAAKHFMKPHQYHRIQTLIDPSRDPLGEGWNVIQSKIAIGSGGAWGKGYLKGTQTKLDFVPEKSTDFIFCTMAEEFGFVGSILFIGLFTLLILRLVMLAERGGSTFATLYGYGVASIFFFHFAINIGMTLGLFPIIGIPLPLISYGGSSLMSFSWMFFTLLVLDRERKGGLSRR